MKETSIKRKIALALAALMLISTVAVPEAEVVKAEETSGNTENSGSTETTVTESMPQTLTVTESSGDDKAIITEGKLQDDGIDNNEAAIYQGENWYYDSITNQLVMNNASIKKIKSENGDLTVLLYGENTISENFYFYIDAEKENTLKIMGCDNKGSLTVTGDIRDGSDRAGIYPGIANLNITDAKMKFSRILFEGSLVIENSEVIGISDDDTIKVEGVTITNSYIEAISNSFIPFGSSEMVCASGSQIVMESGKDYYDYSILYNNKTYNSIITLKWKESDATVSKTNVYGIASLKKDFTLESTYSINFYDENARIDNMEMLSVKDGAGVFVHDSEHKHNTDGGIRYTWKNDSEHTKGLVCRNCPIAYVAEVTEAHSPDESGICVCSKAYQPAVLTTDKYDMDNDGVYDKVYEISNAAQLYWFADKINNENYTSGNINAVLTANIVVNENVLKSDGTLNDGTFTDWTPIGMWAGDDEYYSYSGIFDGQNHTISGLYLNQMGMAGCVGLFGHVGSGGKVSNVRVLDSYFSVNGGVGGVCGNNDGTITNCYNAGMINKLTDDYTYDFGGVCGYNTGTIIDCYNTGNVSGVNYNGGVCGDNDGTIINCYNTGGVCGDYVVGVICVVNFGATVTNCYYLSDTEIDHKDGTVGKTKEQFANGEVAYLLQADRTEEVWGQNIGTDRYPTLGGKKVYQNKEYDSCDENGNVLTITYANEQENKFTHTVDKVDAVGYCTKEGTDIYWKCSKCGKMFRDENAKNEIKDVPVLAPLGHDHGLSVETSEDKTKSSLVFTCKRKGCAENESGHQEKITITAPGDAVLTYDGNSKEASVSQTFSDGTGTLPEVSYSGSNLVGGKPVKAGTYTASITAGEGNDKVTATVKYTIAQAQLTVTKATVENRRYDGTSKVNVTGVTLAGIIGNDTVSVDTTGLQGTLKSANAGSYKEITLPQLMLTGSDAANYKLVQPDSAVALTSDVVISKAAVAPNMPGDTISAANSKEKVKDVTLPENWNWKESDLEKELAVGVAVTATAEYNGADKGNYETESIDIVITRSTCEHKAGEILYSGEGEKAPTCTEDGLGHRECTICHEVIESGIKVAAAHRFSSEWTIDKSATTTEEGSKSHHCTVCDARTDITAIPKLSSGGSASGGGTSSGGGASSGRDVSSGTTDSKQDDTTTGDNTDAQNPADDNKPSDNNKPSENKPEAVGTKLTKSGITYKVTSVKGKTPTVTYMKASKNAKGTVTIPKTVTIDGVKYQVTAIADKAFAGNKKVTKIVIPDTIKKIGKKAFSDCKNLKVIVIKSTKLTSKNTDAKAFAGIKKDVVIQVPKKKLAAYRKLFAKKGLHKKVKVIKIK